MRLRSPRHNEPSFLSDGRIRTLRGYTECTPAYRFRWYYRYCLKIIYLYDITIKINRFKCEKSLFLTIAFEEDCGSVWLNLESLVGNEVKPVGNVAAGSIWWLRHATHGSRTIVVSSEFGHQTLSSRHRWDETSRASELTAVSYYKIIVNLSESNNFE